VLRRLRLWDLWNRMPGELCDVGLHEDDSSDLAASALASRNTTRQAHRSVRQ
jgi:hypothetical protein